MHQCTISCTSCTYSQPYWYQCVQTQGKRDGGKFEFLKNLFLNFENFEKKFFFWFFWNFKNLTDFQSFIFSIWKTLEKKFFRVFFLIFWNQKNFEKFFFWYSEIFFKFLRDKFFFNSRNWVKIFYLKKVFKIFSKFLNF